MENICFSYIKGNSILHKCPAFIKILFIPFINILFFNLPISFCFILILLQFVICFCLKFSIKQQIKDLIPVIYYAILLLFFNVLMILFSSKLEGLITTFFLYFKAPKRLLENQTFIMLVKLFCILQSTSIFFKTSTPLQIRQGFEDIELFIRKLFHLKIQTSISNALSLFINFIPQVFKIWGELERAWRARGAKKGVKMYYKLLPILFSVGMKKAWNTARAVYIRQTCTS